MCGREKLARMQCAGKIILGSTPCPLGIDLLPQAYLDCKVTALPPMSCNGNPRDEGVNLPHTVEEHGATCRL